MSRNSMKNNITTLQSWLKGRQPATVNETPQAKQQAFKSHYTPFKTRLNIQHKQTYMQVWTITTTYVHSYVDWSLLIWKYIDM